jgi:2,3-bisphosphoglycerate-independent phosphoglycerate mutase
MNFKQVILLILDGFGFRKIDAYHPLSQAKTEFFSQIQKYGGFGLLQASGIFVGLDYDEVGGSDAGHISIGTGVIYYQNYTRINLAIKDGSFYQNEALNQAFLYAKRQKTRVHLIGLLTKKPVHAHISHLNALINLAKNYPDVPVFLHIFADGIDEIKGNFWNHLKEIKELIKESNVKLGSICGRFYAMDQENVWVLRTQRAFYLLVEGRGQKIENLDDFIEKNKSSLQDETILEPFVVDEKSKVQNGDALVFFNFRKDGIKQLFQAFFEKDFPHFPRPKRENLLLVTFVPYLEEDKVLVTFPPKKIKTNLTKIISERGLAQIKITEQEKEKNLIYHFNGLYEAQHPKEIRKILPPSEKKLDQKPIQRADEIIDHIIAAITHKSEDLALIVANIPCLDYVGHTGNFSLGVRAFSDLDPYILKLIKNLPEDALLIITSDHGNVEQLINPVTGEPDTTHNKNPVPFLMVSQKLKLKVKNEIIGSLIDIAPTILEILGIEKPSEMEGESLIQILGSD